VSSPSCTLAIKAIPNAPRSEVVGWLGDALKVKVHAPAVEGRANDALCEFFAETFGLPRRAVTVLHGDTSRQKTLRFDSLALADVLHRFPR
jgi:uncharacterized protein (TIGR00251 family)